MKPTMFFYQKSILVQAFLYFAIFTFHCTRPSIKILKVRRVGVKKKAIFRKSVTVLSAKRTSKWIQLFFSMSNTQGYIFLLFLAMFTSFSKWLSLVMCQFTLIFQKKNFFCS